MIKLTKKLNIVACIAFSTLALTSANPQLSTFAMESIKKASELSIEQKQQELDDICTLTDLLETNRPDLKSKFAFDQYTRAMNIMRTLFYRTYNLHCKQFEKKINLFKNSQPSFCEVLNAYKKILDFLENLFNKTLEECRHSLTNIYKSSSNPNSNDCKWFTYPFESCSENEKQFYFNFEKLCWYWFLLGEITTKDIHYLIKHIYTSTTVLNFVDFIDKCFAANLPDTSVEDLINSNDKDMLDILKTYENTNIKFNHFPVASGCVHIPQDHVTYLKVMFSTILKSLIRPSQEFSKYRHPIIRSDC